MALRFEPPYVYGTREELTTELHTAADGWIHQGRLDLAEEAAAAVHALEDQTSSVQVGHQHYVVTQAASARTLP